MTTFVNDYLLQLNEQWEEVDLLVEEAERVFDKNVKLYNALCRSASIILVSHLEGFIKDIAKNLVKDLNANLPFQNMPEAIKRTACQKYLGFDNTAINHYESSIRELKQDLSDSKGYKVSYEPFLFDKNRNPKPSSITIVCDRFGANNIFHKLNESIFDQAFESDRKLSHLLKRFELVVALSTKEFPYKVSNNKFKLNNKKVKGGRSLWETFLDDINQVRHKIVHGNTFANQESIKQLKQRVNKVKLFKLVVTYCLCCAVSN